MSKTMYLVTSGEYSSYCVNAVFDDEALAKAYAGESGSYQVEEYPLNPHADQIRAQTKTHHILMRRDGGVCQHVSYYSDAEPPKIAFRYKQDYRGPKEYLLDLEIVAETDHQAVKAANEIRAQWIASGREWPADD